MVAMSMLLFYVGENGYAIESQPILRIIPAVALKKMPLAPPYFAGLLNFGGKAIPVIDFCQLIEQRATAHVLSSRIILVQDPDAKHLLGILGEKVQDLLPDRIEMLPQSHFHLMTFPYLNQILIHENQMIQYLDLREFFRFLSHDLLTLDEPGNHEF